MTYLEKEELKALSFKAYGVTSKGHHMMEKFGLDFEQAKEILNKVLSAKESIKRGIEDSKAGRIKEGNNEVE